MFNREAEKILGFLIAYRLYIKMRMREATIEKQIQWVLSYVQEGLADICKENILEDLCYDLKLKGLSNRTTLVLSNTRELDRVLSVE